MTELLDEMAQVIREESDEEGVTYARAAAEAILAIPRISAALKALEREEALGKKLGHSVGSNPPA